MRQSILSPQQNLQEQFRQAIEEKDQMCGICGKSEHRLITTCCGGVTCDSCVTKCELAGIETCPFCRDDMWDTNYVDIQNAFKVFKKVSNLLDDKAK